ncbi:MAG: hypothetical protein ABIP63_09545 [Thermoanaerobaculia bacterium]
MTNVRRGLAILIGAYVLLVLVDRFVLIQLLVQRTGLAIVLATVTLLASIGTGFALRALFARAWSPADLDLPRDLLLGYPVFGALCFLVGAVRIAGWTMIPLLSIAALGGLYIVIRRLESRPLVLPPPMRLFPALAVGIVFACGFVTAQAPASSLDELAYHLAIPWSWVKEGRAIDLPLISHSYFPLGIESADLPLLTLMGRDGAVASHFLHLGAALAATLLLYRLTRRDGLLTAAIVATPALALTAGWSMADWPLLGVCAAFVLGLEEEDRPTVTAAITAGLLLKYTFIPFALIALLTTRQGRSMWRALWPAAIAGSLFFVRNLVLTHNPVAPFLTAGAPHVAGYRGHPYLSSYIFDGHFLDESLGASLLTACAAAGGLLPLTILGAAIVLFLMAPSARLLVPYLAIPAARCRPGGRWFRVLLACAIAVQLFLIVFFVDRSEVFSTMSGKASDEEFLARQRPSYTTIKAIDALLPEGSSTLVVGLNETFWFGRRARGGGNFDGERMSRYFEAGVPERLYSQLKADGITHVAIVAPPTAITAVAQKIEERSTVLSPEARRVLSLTLDRYAASVTSRERATLFALR